MEYQPEHLEVFERINDLYISGRSRANTLAQVIVETRNPADMLAVCELEREGDLGEVCIHKKGSLFHWMTEKGTRTFYELLREGRLNAN